MSLPPYFPTDRDGPSFSLGLKSPPHARNQPMVLSDPSGMAPEGDAPRLGDCMMPGYGIFGCLDWGYIATSDNLDATIVRLLLGPPLPPDMQLMMIPIGPPGVSVSGLLRQGTVVSESRRLVQVQMSGGMQAAEAHFQALARGQGASTVTTRLTSTGTVLSVELQGGGSASVRPSSTGGTPTLQVNQPGEPTIKFRYGE